MAVSQDAFVLCRCPFVHRGIEDSPRNEKKIHDFSSANTARRLVPHRGASEVANEAASKVAGHGKRLPPVGCMATTKQAAWNLGGLQDQVWFHDLGAPMEGVPHGVLRY